MKDSSIETPFPAQVSPSHDGGDLAEVLPIRHGYYVVRKEAWEDVKRRLAKLEAAVIRLRVVK